MNDNVSVLVLCTKMLLYYIYIYTFCGASSNPSGPVQNKTGPVHTKILASYFFANFRHCHETFIVTMFSTLGCTNQEICMYCNHLKNVPSCMLATLIITLFYRI